MSIEKEDICAIMFIRDLERILIIFDRNPELNVKSIKKHIKIVHDEPWKVELISQITELLANYPRWLL